MADSWNSTSTTDNWTTSGDWSGGTPTSTSDVTVGEGDPQITTNVGTINSLDVTSGGAVTIVSGGELTVATNLTVSGTFTDDGTGNVTGNVIIADGGHFNIDGVGHAAGFTIDAGGTFDDLGHSTGSITNGITFAGDSTATATLEFDQIITGSSNFTPTLNDFGAHDQILLTGMTYVAGSVSAVVSGTTLTVTSGSASDVFTLGAGSATAFQVTDDGGHVLVTVCFASGTRIATTRGEVAVEALAVGDLAMTSSGKARPIVWIGSRTIANPGADARPVRVAAGAFGAGRPARDLFLSPGHAVCVDVIGEVFVPVEKLVNGASIAQVEVPEVTYWHIELESHDVLLVEGLGCESYMDAGNRAFFGREYGRLAEIDPARVAESLSRYARPLLDGGPLVELVRQRLLERAEALGWTRTSDMDLHLIVDGERLEPEVDGDLALFVFPPQATEAVLVSRTFTPFVQGVSGDKRSLGVSVKGLSVSDGLRMNRDAPLDEIAGFHPEEAVSGSDWRWTDGRLALPAELWADCRARVLLRIVFDPDAGKSWLPPKAGALRAVA